MGKGVLHGVKVADFTTAIAGPLACRMLAAEGATVIKLECHKYPDSVRLVVPYKDDIPGIDRSTQFAFYNFSKYSISVNIQKPQGQDIARRLIRWSDAIVENMSTGSMARLGLDYESCRQIKPDIIYISSSSLGRTGPLASYSAWGYHHGPLAGFSHLIGWPDRVPCGDAIAYTDALTPAFSVIALVGALLYRRKTGKGVYIDQSQTETGVYFLGPAMLDFLVNGTIASRQGNRDPYMSPHGVFPCRGNDRWVALAVSNESEWQAFCKTLGREEWLKDPRFATLITRKKNEDELERLISTWTASRTAEEVTGLLQSAGVAVGPVATAEDLFHDPQLKRRGHFGTLEHEIIGRYSYELPAFRFSKIPQQPQQPAPLIGEDNEHILKEMLGYTDSEIAEFLIAGAITTEADQA
jgi:benzylsuccinate CoA-transferase BbsF subunit